MSEIAVLAGEEVGECFFCGRWHMSEETRMWSSHEAFFSAFHEPTTPTPRYRAPDQVAWAWCDVVVIRVSQFSGQKPYYTLHRPKTGQEWSSVKESAIDRWNPDWVPSVPPLSLAQKHDLLVSWMQQLRIAADEDVGTENDEEWQEKLERLT